AEAALAARNHILQNLAGRGDISAVAAARAVAVAAPLQRHALPRLAAHATARHTQQGQVPAQLTINAGLQARLERLTRHFVSARQANLSAAILVADHQSGEVLAAVGSPGLESAEQRLGHVDMIQAVRSPGSTLKPMVYALAFERGLVHAQ